MGAEMSRYDYSRLPRRLGTIRSPTIRWLPFWIQRHAQLLSGPQEGDGTHGLIHMSCHGSLGTWARSSDGAAFPQVANSSEGFGRIFGWTKYQLPCAMSQQRHQTWECLGNEGKSAVLGG